MERLEYKKIVDKHTKNINKTRNAFIAFIIGGFIFKSPRLNLISDVSYRRLNCFENIDLNNIISRIN